MPTRRTLIIWAVLLILSLTPMLFTAYRHFELSRIALETNALQFQTNIAISAAERADQYIDGLIRKVEHLKNNARAFGTVTNELLKSFINTTPDIISISYVDKNGKELLKASDYVDPEIAMLKDWSTAPFFTSYLDSAVNEPKGEAIVETSGFVMLLSKPTLAIISPLDATDYSRGSILLLVSVSNFLREIGLAQALLGNIQKSFVVDSVGVVVDHVDTEMIGKNLSFSPVVKGSLERISIGTLEYRQPNGQLMLGSYAPIKQPNWQVIIEQPAESAYFGVHELKKRIIHWMSWISFIVVVLTYLISLKFAGLAEKQNGYF